MEIITILDIISAKIASLCFTIILLKLLTKRMKSKKVDQLFMKIHKPAGYMLVIAGVIHMVCSIRAIADTSIWVYVLGTISLIAIIFAIATFVLRKKGLKNWLFWHRTSTVVAFATMLMHLALK